MPVKTSVYLNDATIAKVEALKSRWGPIRPLGLGQVVAEAIERAYAAEGLEPAAEATRTKPRTRKGQ